MRLSVSPSVNPPFHAAGMQKIYKITLIIQKACSEHKADHFSKFYKHFTFQMLKAAGFQILNRLYFAMLNNEIK